MIIDNWNFKLKNSFLEYLTIFLLFFVAVHLHSFSETTEHKQINKDLNKFFRVMNDKHFNTLEQTVEADRLLSIVKNDSLRSLLLVSKGEIHYLLGEYPKATKAMNASLNYYDSTKNNSMLAKIYTDLGEIYRAARSLTTGVDYINKAVSIYTKLQDSLGLTRAYNRISAIHFQSSDFDKATYFAKLSLIYSQPTKNSMEFKANTYNILGAINSHNKSVKGLPYLFQALKLFDSLGIVFDRPNIYTNIATVYMENNDYRNSLKYAEMAFDIAEKYNLRSYYPPVLYIIAKSHYNLRQYKESYEYMYLSHCYADSLINEKKNQQLIEMRTRYELDTSQKEIAYQKNVQIYQGIALGGIILVILFLAINVFSRYKNLKQKNSLLAEKNQLISYQNEQLGELNATKDKFFSIIAHDLKNPLGSIRLVSNVLKDNYPELSENERIDFISEIRHSTNHIITLLDNLLTWARSQTGKITYHPVTFNLRMLVQSNLDLLEKQADLKSIELINETDDFNLYGDPNMMNTVFRNIISNSIKFTPDSGRVKVYNYKKEIENIPYHVITIEDNGVGIQPENISKLFQIESGFSTVGTANEKGTGLGLILCKEFIKHHNGKITAESKLGEGTKINIFLPLI